MAAWITQTPLVPRAQGSQQPQLPETGCYKHSSVASVGSAPMKTECGSGAVAWIAGTRQHQVCREGSDHRCRRYGPIRIRFCPLAADTQRAFLAGPSVLLDIGVPQGHPWPGAFSSAPQVRRTKGRPLWGLSLSASCLRRMWRKATVTAPPAAVTQQWRPASSAAQQFLQRHSVQVSSLLSPWAIIFPQLTAVLALGLLSTPMLQLPAAALSGGLVSSSGVCRTAAWIVRAVVASFSLSLVSCWYSDGLRCFPSVSADRLGSHPCFTSPTPRCRSGPAHSPPLFLFLPSSQGVLRATVYSLLVVRGSC